MKKLVFLMVLVIAASCKKETTVDYAIITGKVTNAPSKSKLILYNTYDFSDRKDITFNEDGTFTDTVAIDKSNFYRLYLNRNSVNLYLTKGEKANVTFDAKKLDSTLNITGKNDKINDYLAKKSQLIKAEKPNDRKLFAQEEAEFKNIIDGIKTKLEELVNNSSLPQTFKKNELNDIKYASLGDLNIYEGYHGYLTKNRDFKVSEGFLDAFKDFDYNNENDFKFSKSYRDIVGSHYNKLGNKLAKEDSISGDIAHLKTLAAIKNETIKNKLLGENTEFNITYAQDLEKFYKTFNEASTDEKSKEKIAKIYNDLQKITKGKPSPKFENYENNAGGTTSLDDLKGKYVYVDVWATWCGPCIGEIPSLKKVEKQYHNKNIEFVSISIDDKQNHSKWKKMIVDKELKGVQLFADNNWNSQFVQDYMIKGIPRFILIDPQGNIVRSNAPRPSDPKLITLFNELKI